jgi:hypothetical protein
MSSLYDTATATGMLMIMLSATVAFGIHKNCTAVAIANSYLRTSVDKMCNNFANSYTKSVGI